MSETKAVPLTCHGHSRPITHFSFSPLLPSDQQQDQYFLLSACKDQSPMLRDGQTGDWIGTFLGHKGAVWSSRLSADASLAVTGSADFTAKVWDAFTGECLVTVQEGHIVRAVGVSGEAGQAGSAINGERGRKAGLKIATGGMEKKVKIWDLGRLGELGSGGEAATNGAVTEGKTVKEFTEVGKGVHTGTVKSLLWTKADPENGVVSAADDKVVRWWDLRQSERPIAQHQVEGLIGSCEVNDVDPEMAGGDPGILSVAAGKSVYFFDGAQPGQLIKQVKMAKEVSCVAVNRASGRFVTGSGADTWVRIWDLDTEEELETLKGHHGPVWTCAYSPDGKLYATGSEDGTIKLWKATKDAYGLWR